MISDHLSCNEGGSLVVHSDPQVRVDTPIVQDLVEMNNPVVGGWDPALASHQSASKSEDDRTPLALSSMSRRRRASSKPILDGRLFLPPPPAFASLYVFPISTSPSPASSSPPVSLNVLHYDTGLKPSSCTPSTPMDQVCNGHSTPPDAPRQPVIKRKRAPFLVATQLPRSDVKATADYQPTVQNAQISPEPYSVVSIQPRRPSLDALGPLRRKLLSGFPRRLSYGPNVGSPSTPSSADTSSSSDSLASPVVLEAPQTYVPKRACQIMQSPMSPKNTNSPTECTGSPSYFTFTYR